jgi:pimeloyl-ACP methyl ester carboxylesterase
MVSAPNSVRPRAFEGNADPSSPPSIAYGFLEAIPGAKITVIPDASHIVTVEAPVAGNDALGALLIALED